MTNEQEITDERIAQLLAAKSFQGPAYVGPGEVLLLVREVRRLRDRLEKVEADLDGFVHGSL